MCLFIFIIYVIVMFIHIFIINYIVYFCVQLEQYSVTCFGGLCFAYAILLVVVSTVLFRKKDLCFIYFYS